jgi:hypothetical protein
LLFTDDDMELSGAVNSEDQIELNIRSLTWPRNKGKHAIPIDDGPDAPLRGPFSTFSAAMALDI